MLLSLAIAAALILIAAAAGWRAQARAAAPDWFTRMAAAMVPPAAMCFAIQTAVTIALGTFFGWDDIPAPFVKPLEDGRIVGFMKQKPEVGGETAVRLLVKHIKGEPVPAQFSYRPDVVTIYNLDKFR